MMNWFKQNIGLPIARAWSWLKQKAAALLGSLSKKKPAKRSKRPSPVCAKSKQQKNTNPKSLTNPTLTNLESILSAALGRKEAV